ncbi:flagellar basal-body rod protein FlgF [Chitinivibrio alkaliphilus]|uniref:Flagellar basal-body rod protein FlgF n=1 Tax=Chitinivibrio alkaliphilus ACht1 TaxID=1313304 RepID=U7DAD4_9BACT|nr:flagellar basal-body rod protein FlgF [Chitinivibrio alkaliphilus]ERP39359.1 flagellar basal-body rod protein FlgF [Chitinivibrio alkaliphilus ACht1]
MVSGIQHAVQGMTLQTQRQDQIANNLANVNTTGYKRRDLFASSIEKHLQDDRGRVSGQRVLRADETYTDFSDGVVEQTGNPLDFAIQGEGFFSVMRPSGVAYTRDGSFSLDQEGFLITGSGDRVFGDSGFIKVDPEGGELNVLQDGTVLQDNVEIDRLRISDFPRPYKMLGVGDNYYRPEADGTGKNVSSPLRSGFEIQQGYLERSNVNPVHEMTGMISSHRVYEATAKAMQSQDETLDKAVNTVGRVQ